MKEYRVIKEKSTEDAEATMNCMAGQGWTVKAVTFLYSLRYCLAVTFERDRSDHE